MRLGLTLKLLAITALCALLGAACTAGGQGGAGLPRNSPVPEQTVVPLGETLPAQEAAIEPKGELPAFPVPRSGLGITEYVALGADAEQRSNSSVKSGSDLLLIPPAAGLSWAIWRFQPHGGHLERLDVLLNLDKGKQAWVMLADFQSGRWTVRGPFSKSEGMLIERARHVSPDGNVYAAVVAYGNNLVRVRALSLRAYSTDGQPPLAELAADIDFGHAPLEISFDASESSDPQGQISHYLWDFEGDGAFEGLSFEPTISHVYTEGGDYDATVLVVDNDGDHAEASVPIALNSLPQVTLKASRLTAFSGEIVEFVAEASDAEGSIVSILWDINGDGEFSGDTNEGSFDDQVAVQLPATKPDAMSVSVQVRDEQAGYSTASVTLLVHGYLETTLTQTNLYHSIAAVDIEGRPAVFFGRSGKLYYIIRRVGDWDSLFDTVSIDSAYPQSGAELQLSLINDHPAVAYTNSANGGLFYGYSETNTGLGSDNWKIVQLAAQSAGKHGVALAQIEDIPAVVFSGPGESGLFYRRSLTDRGIEQTDWQAPVQISEELPTSQLSLLEYRYGPATTTVLGGEVRLLFSDNDMGDGTENWYEADAFAPGMQLLGNAIFNAERIALAFLEEGNLFFARPDEYYSDWQFTNIAETEITPQKTVMQPVRGRPCIALRGAETVQVYWASDEQGTSWQAWPDYLLKYSGPGGMAIADVEDKPLIVLGQQNWLSMLYVR